MSYVRPVIREIQSGSADGTSFTVALSSNCKSGDGVLIFRLHDGSGTYSGIATPSFATGETLTLESGANTNGVSNAAPSGQVTWGGAKSKVWSTRLSSNGARNISVSGTSGITAVVIAVVYDGSTIASWGQWLDVETPSLADQIAPVRSSTTSTYTMPTMTPVYPNPNFVGFFGTAIAETSTGYTAGSGFTKSHEKKSPNSNYANGVVITRAINGRGTGSNTTGTVTYTSSTTDRQRAQVAHGFLIRGRVNTANGWGIDYTQADASAGGVSGSNDRSSSSLPWPIPIQASPGGRSQKSTVIVMPDSTMRYEMKPPSTYTVAEALLNENEFYPGDQRYFGQAFYLPDNFPMNTNGEFQVIEQLHGAPDNGSPVVAFEVRDGYLYMTGGANKPTNTSSGASTNDFAYSEQLMPLVKNKWYNLVYYVQFGETQATSSVYVWMVDSNSSNGNFTTLLEDYKPACGTIYPPTATVTNGGPTYRKFGLYHRQTLPGGTLYQSGIKQSTTYGNASPWEYIPGSTDYAGASSMPATALFTFNSAPSINARPTALIEAAAAISTTANVGSRGNLDAMLATASMSATARQTHGFLIALASTQATLAAQPFVTVRGVTANLDATAALLSRPAYAGASGMSATATASFTAYVIRRMSAMELSSSASLAAAATVLPALYVPMYSSGYLEADPTLNIVAAIAMTSHSVAEFNGYKETWGESSLTGTASLAANAVLRLRASSALLATASLALGAPNVNLRITPNPFAAPANLTVRFDPVNFSLSQIFYAPAGISVGTPRRDLAASANLNVESTFGNPDVFDAASLLTAASDMLITGTSQRHALTFTFGATALITAKATLNQYVYQVLEQSDSLQSYLTAEARISVPGEIVLNAKAGFFADPYIYTPIFVEPKGERVRQEPLPIMRLYVFDTITGRVGWELPYSALSWSTKLNSNGTMSATVVVEAVLESILAQGFTDPIRIFREFLTGPYRFSLAVCYGTAVVWAGPFLPSNDSAGEPTISIQGIEIDRMFEHRLLINPGSGSVTDVSRDVKFKSSGKRGHIYRIVEHATNGLGRRLPIVCSDPPLLRGEETVSYNSYDLVTAAKAIEEIVTSDGGPDLRFDPFLIAGSDGLYVNWDMKIGDPYLDYAQKWTWDDADIALSRDTDAVGLATWVYSPGSGQDRTKLVGQAHSDYLTMLGFPVLEKVEGSNTSATEIRDLDSIAAGAVRAGQQPTQKWTAKVWRDGLQNVGMYRVGDPIGIDVRKHPTIEHGYYDKRIIELSGDANEQVTIVCDSDVKEMSQELPIIIGAALPPILNNRWSTGLVNESSIQRTDFWRSTTPVINTDTSWYRGNAMRINLPPDGGQEPYAGSVAPSGGFQSAHIQPAVAGAGGENLGYFKEGDTGSFGISFVLLPGFPTIYNSPISIMQLDDWEGYNDALLQLCIQGGRLCIRGLRTNNVYWDLGPVETGRRYDVVVQAKFSTYYSKSIISAWVDGIQLIFDRQFGGSLMYSNSIGDFWLVGIEREGSISEAASIEYGAFAYDKDPRAVLAFLAQT